MYKLKQKYEDFIVKEVSNLKVARSGNYGYYLLKKRNWSTLAAVNKIAASLRIKNSHVGLAGNKDKWAITEQYISVYKVDKKKVEGLRIKDIDLKFIGYGNDKINLGDLEGNKFDIVIRNLDGKDKLDARYVENYFDEQRFGFNLNTHIIGKNIVKKNFKEACELLKMDVKGNDYIGELRKRDRRELRFFVHSYASWIWNRVASRYLKENYDVERKINIAGQEFVFIKDAENIDKQIPIIGYLMEVKDDKIAKIYGDVMGEEEITEKDFISKQMPEASSEGGKRKLFITVKDFEYEYGNDEMNKGKYKCNLRFMLSKGAYATLVVKKIFG